MRMNLGNIILTIGLCIIVSALDSMRAGNHYRGRTLISVPGKQRLLFRRNWLVPNTVFVMDVLELNAYGEIVIDCQTCTGVPGVFAAGDMTHVHDQQVLVAAREGVKAALRAHKYLLAGR